MGHIDGGYVLFYITCSVSDDLYKGQLI